MSTVRQQLREALRGPAKTALQLSGELGQSERQILEHLEHLRRSITREGLRLSIEPAYCHGCGHRFDDRRRLGRPSRCPACRAERIEPPRFSIS